jgi:hypothetical protein
MGAEKYFRENYVFGMETNQSYTFGTQKFELFYQAPSLKISSLDGTAVHLINPSVR